MARKKFTELRKAAGGKHTAPQPETNPRSEADSPQIAASSHSPATSPATSLDSAAPSRSAAASRPGAVAAMITSIAVVVHMAAISVAYLAVVRSSGIQGRIVDGFAPYLATLHLAPEGNSADAVAAEGVAFHLARGDGAERVYRLQVASGEKPGDESQWREATWIVEGGSERARRYQRFLAAVADLGVNDQNSLAGRLVLPALRGDAEADWVRIVRLPNLMTNVVQDAEPAPYTAAILRGDGGTRLVRVPQPRLTSAATQ